jgi:hypothetical protein
LRQRVKSAERTYLTGGSRVERAWSCGRREAATYDAWARRVVSQVGVRALTAGPPLSVRARE